MQVSDDECQEFVRLCREEGNTGLTIAEARHLLTNLLLLLERFACWQREQRGFDRR